MPKSPTSKHPADTAAAALWLLNGNLLDEARLASLAASLGPGERLRYRNFLRPQRAREFLLGRVLLRHAACGMLGIGNEHIVVTEREGNAPSLAFSSQQPHDLLPFHFSLSHSRGWIACAASMAFHVGLDIEDKHYPRDITALGAAAFDAEDLIRLEKLSDAQRADAFYLLWNGNEALYKLQHNLGQEAGTISAGWNCRTLPHAHLAICLCSDGDLAVLDVIELDTI